jgi:DNA-binding beta-propeller fold protein YncE
MVWRVQNFDKSRPPGLLAMDEGWTRAYVGLSSGGLVVLNMRDLEVEKEIPLESEINFLTSGPKTGMVYGVSNSGELMLIDATNGQVSARVDGLDRPRGLAFDPQTKSLLVADSGKGAIVRFRDDLAVHLATRSLDALPDKILLDPVGRRLYVMLPGARRVMAMDADTLHPLAEVELPGGPLIEMVLDAAHGRLYVLSALSPRYRGISVLKTDDLSSLALVAGSLVTPLTQATALVLSANGHLLVAEGSSLYQISTEDFDVVTRARFEYPVERGGLAADPITGIAMWLSPAGVFVERGLVAP